MTSQVPGPKVLKFYSQTCPPCKALSPITKEISEENPEVDFQGIDIGVDQEAVQKYGIKSVPTLVFLKHGQEVDRLVGLQTKQAIEERVFLLLE